MAGLCVNALEVTKTCDVYVVRVHRGKSTGNSRAKAFLNSISQNSWQSADPKAKNPSPMRPEPAQILQADNAKRLRRLQPTEIADPQKLSTLLSVVCDYLDRNGADEFAVEYDSASLTVQYGQKSKRLRIDVLYDLGVHMYLRGRTVATRVSIPMPASSVSFYFIKSN